MFSFASCDWNGFPGARNHIQKMYPNKVIDDTKISKLIDLINKDILRVQDPDCHQPCQIVQGTKFKEDEHQELVDAAIQEFVQNVHNAK
jgi:hypothetical protein